MIENQIIINNLNISKFPISFKRSLLKYHLSNDILEALFLDPEFNNYLSLIAENKYCPLYILEKLANNMDCKIRRAVAINPNSTLELLEKLYEDQDFRVREKVARNNNCSINMLEKLSDDENWVVRYYVAKNKKCDLKLLEKLSNDKHYNVRLNVLKNRKCSPNIISILYKEFPNLSVKHPKCPKYLKVLSK